MQRRLTISVPWTLAAGLFAVLATLLIWLSFPGASDSRSLALQNGAMLRLAQDSWNDGQISSDSTEPVVFYDKKVGASKDYTTLYVTFTATSEQHEGAVNLSCWIDGNDCDSYGNPVRLQWNEGADWHDNSVTQSWCIQARKGEITLGLDNTDGGGEGLAPIIHAPTPKDGLGVGVFIEHATVTIDAVKIAGCTANHWIQVGGEPAAPVIHGH